jgi:hypothetical protein
MTSTLKRAPRNRSIYSRLRGSEGLEALAAARAINAAKREITPRFHRIFTAFDVSDFTESYTK